MNPEGPFITEARRTITGVEYVATGVAMDNGQAAAVLVHVAGRPSDTIAQYGTDDPDETTTRAELAEWTSRVLDVMAEDATQEAADAAKDAAR